MAQSDALLEGTPYLIPHDDQSQAGFDKARARASETRERAVRANQQIKSDAQLLLGPYIEAARTDLVAESNTIEGYDWNAEAVREAIRTHRELLEAPVRTLIDSVRADDRVYEALGLYRAHQLADEWSGSERPPRAHEVRALHELILGDTPISGRFKMHENKISGTDHRTASPADTPRQVLDLTDWWADGAGDPLLTATVVHAWLAHIHPFEDGNGRLARILANLELARHGYPPLTIRAASDRGEYYTALGESDDGNLLPLYDLFGRVLRRQSKLMARPDYVLNVVKDRLLADDRQRHQIWLSSLARFTSALEEALASRGATLEVQGTPDLTSFKLLCERDVDGNGWHAKVRRSNRPAEWLIWFGYRTPEWMELDDEDVYPSLFVSRRAHGSAALHPFTPDFSRDDIHPDLPDEISILPVAHHTTLIRNQFEIEPHEPRAAAERLAASLASAL